MAEPTQSSPWPTSLSSSADLQSKIRSAKVLCIGAGGIGCELLKTLVCTGFQHIELIDLDTIETSNLNRQFLFRKHHVGQSKAQVAADVVKGIKPQAAIVAHHANVKEARFNIDYFKQFDLVLNGLDNLDARRHVNRLCMAAQRPLIESGTAGYLGQVTVHLKGKTECFECQPKSAPKSFPICTLRNTPDRPIHCIVWAKDLLFPRLFGKPEAVTDLDETSKEQGGGAAAAEAEANGGGSGAERRADGGEANGGERRTEEEEAEARAKEDASYFVRRDGEEAVAYAARVFGRAYDEDMERLANMADLWKKRAPPKPLRLAELLPDMHSDVSAALARAAAAAPGSSLAASASKALGLSNPNAKWDASDNARVFVTSIAMFLQQRPSEVGSLEFDKDDDLAVDFVTAASNLRSLCYDIPVESLFEAKGKAGNIIHAIATTNAIISGLIVVEALKVLAGTLDASRCTFLNEEVSNKRVIIANKTEGPRAGCMTCGQAQLHFHVNTKAMTLSQLLSAVVKKRLAVCVPMLQCGDFLYEEGEGLDEDEVEMYQGLLTRTLAALPGGGLHGGSIVSVRDELQHFSLELIVCHNETLDDEKAPEGFILEGDVPVAKAEEQGQDKAGPSRTAGAGAGTAATAATAVEEDDGFVMLDDEDVAPKTARDEGKRKRVEDGRGEGGKEQQPGSSKKAKKDGPGGGADADDPIVL